MFCKSESTYLIGGCVCVERNLNIYSSRYLPIIFFFENVVFNKDVWRTPSSFFFSGPCNIKNCLDSKKITQNHSYNGNNGVGISLRWVFDTSVFQKYARRHKILYARWVYVEKIGTTGWVLENLFLVGLITKCNNWPNFILISYSYWLWIPITIATKALQSGQTEFIDQVFSIIIVVSCVFLFGLAPCQWIFVIADWRFYANK